jgi:hypothetical protein
MVSMASVYCEIPGRFMYLLNTFRQEVLQFMRSEFYVRDKGNAFPLRHVAGPSGSWRLRLPDFKTIGT